VLPLLANMHCLPVEQSPQWRMPPQPSPSSPHWCILSVQLSGVQGDTVSAHAELAQAWLAPQVTPPLLPSQVTTLLQPSLTAPHLPLQISPIGLGVHTTGGGAPHLLGALCPQIKPTSQVLQLRKAPQLSGTWPQSSSAQAVLQPGPVSFTTCLASCTFASAGAASLLPPSLSWVELASRSSPPSSLNGDP
jgi:hypothetical protein